MFQIGDIVRSHSPFTDGLVGTVVTLNGELGCTGVRFYGWKGGHSLGFLSGENMTEGWFIHPEDLTKMKSVKISTRSDIQ